MALRMKIFGGSLKNPTFTGEEGGSQKTNIEEGIA